jgi:cytochrome c oxidase assembly factor CtaG
MPSNVWHFESVPLAGIVIGAMLYAVGRRRLRGQYPRESWRVWAFALGMLSLTAAVVPPIGGLTEELFWVHMVQHLLIILVGAPLVLLGTPLVPILWGLPWEWRRKVGQLLVPGRPVAKVLDALTHPWVAMGLFLGTLTVWHVPVLYDAAQGSSPIHYLEHIFFFGTAVLYWWPLVHPMGGPRRLGYGLGILYTIPPLLQNNVLGALISLSQHPIYATYLNAPRIGGLSVVEDQQLGGLIMWVPGGFYWAIPFFTMLVLFLQHEESQTRRAEAVRRAASRP